MIGALACGVTALALSVSPYIALDAGSDWEVVYMDEVDGCLDPWTLRRDGPDSMPVAWINRQKTPPEVYASHSSLSISSPLHVDPSPQSAVS
jgi:hypothetical protein